MSSTLIERLTWPEIQAAIVSGRSRVIIVCASTEQHGPHLPEATDALIGEAVGERLAMELGDALVAPVIRPGCSDHHLGFPGTISISPDTLIAMVDTYVDCLRRGGFARFSIVSSHGGNYPVLKTWAERGLPSDVQAVTDLDGFIEAMVGAARSFGRDDATIPHADVSETAEMLALHPNLVRIERAARGYVGPMDLREVQRMGLKAISPNGVLGDPRGATSAMGEAVIESVVKFFARHLS